MALDRTGGVTRRTFVQGSLAASALAALAACGRNNSASEAKKGPQVMKYYINNPVAIDPYNVQESEGTAVEHVLFDPLVRYDWKAKKLLPFACEKWEVSEDAKTFTFTLKKATFHNGDPVDAASFKRGWQRTADPNMATPGEIGYHISAVVGYDEFVEGKASEITGLTCPDERTFKVELQYPMADFLAICAHPGLVPVPEAALKDPAGFLLAPIGNGPFMMDGKWEPDQYINIKRYDNYYGDKATLDAVNFSIQKDPQTAYREFEAGNIDFTAALSGRTKEAVSKFGKSEDGYTATPGKQTILGATAAVYYLIFNMEHPVTKNPDVRHAISLAINRKAIIDSLFEGNRQAADCVFPPIIDSDKSNAWEYAQYDPARAKQIVNEKGLAGTKIELSYNAGGGHEDIFTLIQADLEAAGFTVVQKTQEWAAYLKSLTAGDFMVGRLGWIADYPTMDNFLYPNFFSTADNNRSRYNNPDMDQALLKARSIVDADERAVAMRRINGVIGEDLPIAPIMFYAHNKVASDKVKSFYFDPQDHGDFAHAEMK